MSAAQTSSAPVLAIRHLGTCPICQTEFKARGEGVALEMVHHGFRRPRGWGQIIGDCFGVHHAPYELSSAGCASYRIFCEETRAHATKWFATLTGPEADWPETFTHFSRLNPSKSTTFRRDIPEERRQYDICRRDVLRETENRIENLGLEIARMTRLIDAWTLQPVKEWSEEIEAAQLKAERDARATEAAAKRAAKVAKRAAINAKHAALAAKRKELSDGIAAEFAALASQPAGRARDASVRLLIKKFDGPKYRFMAAYELPAAPLVALDLAVMLPEGRVDLAKFHAVRS